VATCSMGQVATGVHLGPSNWSGLALPCLELHTCCSFGGIASEKVGRVPRGFSKSSVENQPRSRDIIGIYPMQQNNNENFYVKYEYK
jgi:hypothetical protein